MTRLLVRLADLSYRRRGRMVLAWLAAMVVTIGLGSALAGEYNANYDTPGSESKAAGDLTQERFGGYSGGEVYVVWKDPDGANSSAARDARRRLPRRGEEGRPRRRGDAGPVLEGRHDRVDHPSADD